VAVTTFCIGLGVALLWSDSAQQDKHKAFALESVEILKPARISRYMDEFSFASSQIMLVSQPSRPLVTEPVKLYADDIVEGNCGMLDIYVDDDRRVFLNMDEIGTLDNFTTVTAKLREVFDERVKKRVYAPDLQLREDLSEEERIYKTVLISPSPSLTNSEVIRLIELTRATGAKPIAIRTAPFN
jgi:hypothetical protein